MTALRALMSELIDYAGLFPPARLEMAGAVGTYARHRAGRHAWMLSRFICPVARFAEFEAAVEQQGIDNGDPWRISALASPELIGEAIEAMTAMEERQDGRVVVDCAEIKVDDVHQIDGVLDCVLDERIKVFFEVPLDRDVRGFLAALSGTGAAAKIRTGGVTADLVPTASAVAEFIACCRDVNLPFKATAGLHHPLRQQSEELGCLMHGFLNVFGAGVLARTCDLDAGRIQRILETTDATAFHFDEEVLRIGEYAVSTDEIQRGRQFAMSFGSCSFDEPVADLVNLGLLSPEK